MVRVATEADIPRINEIMNEPSVKAGALFAKDQEVDGGVFMKIGFVLMANGGCFICLPVDNETLDVHTNFLPGFRGKNAMEEAKAGLRMVLAELGVTRIFTKMRSDAAATKRFTEWVGFDKVGTDGEFSLYQLGVEKFVGNDEKFKELGAHLVSEAPPIASGFIGFARACAYAGVPWKGVALYNRMASVCGWPQMEWNSSDLSVSLNGHVIDSGIAQLTEDEGD